MFERRIVINMRFLISNTSLKPYIQIHPQSKYSSVFAWSHLHHPTLYPEQEPSIYVELWNTNKQHMSVIFQSTSYSQSQASPKKRHLRASSAVEKVCRHTQFTYLIQRILTEVSSTLMLLVKNTNIHIGSRRLSIILVLL